MSSFRSPDLLERRSNAATIKKMMLEKFRAARQDPALEQQRLKRIAVNEARASSIIKCASFVIGLPTWPRRECRRFAAHAMVATRRFGYRRNRLPHRPRFVLAAQISPAAKPNGSLSAVSLP